MSRVHFCHRLCLAVILAVSQNPFLPGQEGATDKTSAVAADKEQHYQRLMHYELHSRESFQKELELSGSQIQALQAAHQKFMNDFQQVGVERGKLYKTLQNGELDKPTYEKALQDSKLAEEKVKEDFHSSVESILLPYQRRLIAKRAKRIRVTRVKDEFEVPVILAKEKGLPPAVIRRIAQAVNKARKEHYAELQEIRERIEKSTLAKMDPDLRRQFTRMYGDFYDYESERVIELTREENDRE